jgi:hypothetical protein
MMLIHIKPISQLNEPLPSNVGLESITCRSQIALIGVCTIMIIVIFRLKIKLNIRLLGDRYRKTVAFISLRTLNIL